MLWPLGHYDYEVHKRHLKIESSPTAHDDIFSVIRQNALSFCHLILSTALFFLITTHTHMMDYSGNHYQMLFNISNILTP